MFGKLFIIMILLSSAALALSGKRMMSVQYILKTPNPYGKLGKIAHANKDIDLDQYACTSLDGPFCSEFSTRSSSELELSSICNEKNSLDSA
jgi:hypothetical protein